LAWWCRWTEEPSSSRRPQDACVGIRGRPQARRSVGAPALKEDSIIRKHSFLILAASAATTAGVVAGPLANAADASTGSSSGWQALRQCESGGNYSTDTGNGYYGAYQFSASTWHSLGYSGLPSQASPATQDQAAQQLRQRSSSSQWPSCSSQLGSVPTAAASSTAPATNRAATATPASTKTVPAAPAVASAMSAFAPYVVKPGDTLSIIAMRFSTSVTALTAANHLANPNLILAGQTLLA